MARAQGYHDAEFIEWTHWQFFTARQSH
jgi:hypothetical protein